MEWRQQTTVSCTQAFTEAQRWIQEVTGKSFDCNDFRAALENGVLLCDLINRLKPGIIKRVNRLSTPIAGLDNVNVFLKGCEKLGLNDSQLFHSGDLQDLSTRAPLRRDESSRRLKNVLITIYWLGRKAHLDTLYNGPQLNFKAFEGLLGLALSKALEDGGNTTVKDGGYRECQCAERDRCQHWRLSAESLDSRTVRPNADGCGSDAEAEQVFRMESTRQNDDQVPAPPLRSKQTWEEKRSVASLSPLSRSKSLSDIPMVYPTHKVPGEPVYGEIQHSGLARQWSQESRGTCFVAAKDSEAQWQDDFTKWKNRRRSTKSDLRMKSQDRDHVISQMTNGSAVNHEKNEAQHRLAKRDQQPLRKHGAAAQPYSTSPPSKSFSSDLRPHTRALLTRGYATEAPFSPSAPLSRHSSAHTGGSSLGAMPASDGNILGEETHFASDGARITTPSPDFRFSSQDQVRAEDIPRSIPEVTKPGNVFISQISTFVTTIKPNETAKAASGRNSSVLLSSHERRSVCIGSEVKNHDASPDAADRSPVKAEEDSSHQNHSKSQEEGRMSCFDPPATTARGQQAARVSNSMSRTCSWSGSASLPRGYRRSEGSARLSSAITARPFVAKQTKMSPRADDNQGLLLSTEKEYSSPAISALRRQTATIYLRSQQPSVRQKAEQGGSASPSTQASLQPAQPHLLPQPYSNLQHHRNKSLSSPANGSTDPEKVDRSDMRVSLTLKPNSIPDFGFQTHWDSTGAKVKAVRPGSPAELCRLRVNDEIVAVDGVLVAHMNYSQWKDKMASVLQTGELTMDVRRCGYKDWSAGEENHNSQSVMTLKLPAAAPALIACPDHCEAAFANVSKCNAPTNDMIQGEVMSGVLSNNPRTARSEGGSESAISDLQVPSLSPSSSGWSWDREEDRRRQEKWQEEQERLLQEQYQRDQERLEAEWQRAQQEAMAVRKSGQTSFETTDSGRPVGSQLFMNGQLMKPGEKQRSPEREELNVARVTPPSTVHGVQSDNNAQNGWADASCGFTQLSPTHRAKSLSTSVLADAHKQTRGDQRKSKGQQISKAEQDRQQILEEMKKRTQLLTDSSWIRQRSSSFYKEPASAGVPLKRYESLDNLDALRHSPSLNTTFSFSRPHSAAGFCAPSRNAYSRYSTGTMLSQKNTSMEPSLHGSAGAAVDVLQEQRGESRFESDAGNQTVIPAISNSSPLVSSAFDQHAVLEIEE